jgi:Ca-activated chloride channel family protein
MPEWGFRDPWLLLTLLLAPLLYVLLARRSRAAVTYSTLSLVERAPRSLRARFANLPAWLLALAMGSVGVALAGPRTPDEQTRIHREGIAIAMVVDRSGSMDARDLRPDDANVNRLDVVKSVFRRFVLGHEEAKGRPDDMIGLVAFARYADSLCPLTLDHGNLINIVDDLAIVTRREEDGTALGEGLALAVERLRESPARSKVAILLTDGVNNAGEISPEQAAELAAVHHVKVYCIGAGTTGTAPYPMRDPFTGQIGLRPVRVEIDEDALKAIADKTGGQYFRATDAESLARIYEQIDQLERTEIQQVKYLEYHEHYALFALSALALLAVGTLASATLFRRLP